MFNTKRLHIRTGEELEHRKSYGVSLTAFDPPRNPYFSIQWESTIELGRKQIVLIWYRKGKTNPYYRILRKEEAHA